MYKYILFDLDDTILDFKASEHESIKLILKDYNLDTIDNIKLFQEINELAFNRFQDGIYKTRLDFQLDRFKLFFDKFNLNLDYKLINELYLNNLQEIVILKNNALNILNYLKDKYKLFIVSNGYESVQIKRLEKCGLLNYFEKLYISSSIGYNKPKKEFFDYVHNDILGKKEEYLIIGDRYETDIIGGINFQIDQVLLGEGKATYVIKDLIELKNIL